MSYFFNLIELSCEILILIIHVIQNIKFKVEKFNLNFKPLFHEQFQCQMGIKIKITYDRRKLIYPPNDQPKNYFNSKFHLQ